MCAAVQWVVRARTLLPLRPAWFTVWELQDHQAGWSRGRSSAVPIAAAPGVRSVRGVAE